MISVAFHRLRPCTSGLVLVSLMLAGRDTGLAQQSGGARPIRPPVADTGIFSPLPFPEATQQRRATGAPGAGYWQQRADYRIKATLDTASKTIEGTVELRYTNNSPDSLRHLWMQVDQNLFKPGSVGSFLFDPTSRNGAAGFQGGMTVSSITQQEPSGPGARARGDRAGESGGTQLKFRIDDTMMSVELARILAPRGTTVITIAYSFPVPEHGGDRMGRDGSLYEIAQWFPRMTVYDDVRGWNTDQYLGPGEFYLEYGDIGYEVTVPAGYIVAGSGLLQNPLEVLTATERARLALAAKSDTTIHIITESDLTSGAARPRKDGMLTWRFQANNVRDVAWAASPDYLWDASAWEGILAHSYYRPTAPTPWRDGAKMSRFSIQEYSTRWFRYPYPQISAIEGPISGMEYPMVAMEADWKTPEQLYNVVTHEIGHMWYPMIVGSDERRYAWMDEGFNTFINTFSEEDYWKRDDTEQRRGESKYVTGLDQGPTPQAIMTPANRYLGGAAGMMGSLAYVKPSIMLLALRNKVLGTEVFDAAFREYTRRWAFKHPQPADFFRTIEDVSGRDLSWFWRSWFYTTSALDQAVDTVRQYSDSTGKRRTEIGLRNLGAAVMPVELELTYSDGTVDLRKLPVEIWYYGNRYTWQPAIDKTIVRARVNPDGGFPDINPTNDSWGQAPGTP